MLSVTAILTSNTGSIHRTKARSSKVYRSFLSVRLGRCAGSDRLTLVYNWENRFMSVNYNLQILSEIPVNERFTETGTCHFELQFGLKYTQWVCRRLISEDFSQKDAYLARLSNPLIMDRIRALDIFDLEIRHEEGSGAFTISMESMIGSATWILIPPITNLILPRTEECVQSFELFELLGDAVVNNGL